MTNGKLCQLTNTVKCNLQPTAKSLSGGNTELPKPKERPLLFCLVNLSLTERIRYTDIAELRVQIPSKPDGKVVGVQVIFLWGDVMDFAEDVALEWIEELGRIGGEAIKKLDKRRVPKRYQDSPGWAKQKHLSE